MLWGGGPAYGVKSICSKNKYWNLIDLISIIPNPINRIAFSRNTRHLSHPSRRTPEHLAISDVSISIVTHYFDESFLQTKKDYGNNYPESHFSDSIVEDTMKSDEFAIIYLIHA